MSDFCPALWSEELVPNNVKDCCKCGLDKHGTRMVWGERNPDSPIMIILDNPGAREDLEGNSLSVEHDRPYNKQPVKLD